MVYKHYKIQTLIRLVLIVITIMGSSYLFFKTPFYFTASVLVVFSFVQAYWLLNLIQKANRELTIFLDSIRYAEFNRSFKSSGLGLGFNELSSSFNEVLADFHSIRKEKEEQFYFYQNIFQHIAISMIAFDDDGQILMVNNAANRLFKIQNPKTLDALNTFSNELVELLKTIKNNQKQLIKVQVENDFLQLSVHAKIFEQEKQIIKIVSIQNIESELEQNEIESWQKLIRVLTHEIMNSITPISSLSDTTYQMVTTLFNNIELDEENSEIKDDIVTALSTVIRRSNGLIQFVKTYRNLTHIPTVNFSLIKVNSFFDNIFRLMNNEMETNNIKLSKTVYPETIEISADENLMTQVVINLIRNSIQVLQKHDNPQIILNACYGSYGHTHIQVIDNGPGILPEVLDKIFIPFFTTKANGSGIGLSLSRQLIKAQGGNLSVVSNPGKTVFTVRL